MRTHILVSHAVAVTACLLTLLIGPPARADVPTLLSFQGMLKSPTGTPLQGAQVVRFSLYNGPTGNQGVANEIATIGAAGGTVSLLNRPVAAGSETVAKSDGSATYARGIAYAIDNLNGVITNVSIPANTTLKISYQWVPTSFWSEEQTVQANNGMFAALLGVNATIPYHAFTGSEFLQVEVRTAGGAFDVLSPRQRLTAAPYALRVASVDGASGGEIDGGITASGTVRGTGASYQIGRPPFMLNITGAGIEGMGVTGTGGEAPGVLAVGANNGTGLALSAKGSMTTTGDVTAGGNLRVKGTTTTEGASYTYGNGQVSGLLNVGNLTAAGNIGAGLDVSAGQDLKATRNASIGGTADVAGAMTVGGNATIKGTAGVWKDFTVSEDLFVAGDIYTNLNMTVNKLFEARGDATFKRSLTVSGQAAVVGQLDVTGPIRGVDEISTQSNLRAGGRIYALGMPKPDHEGTVSVGITDFEKDTTLPAALGSDISNWTWETYVTEYSDSGGVITEKNWLPSGRENLQFVMIRVTTGGASGVTFRIRKMFDNPREYTIKLRVWKINR